MTTTDWALGLIGGLIAMVILASPVILAALWLKKREGKKDGGASYICTQCGTAGAPLKELQGNAGVELLLYLSFILPGLIYSAWRGAGRRNICRVCKTPTMIPADSPRGKKLMADASVTA